MGCYQGKSKDIIQPNSVSGNQRNLILPQIIQKEQITHEKTVHHRSATDTKRTESVRHSDVQTILPKEYWVYNPNIEKKLRVPQLNSADNCGIWKRRDRRCTSIEAGLPRDQTS